MKSAPHQRLVMVGDRDVPCRHSVRSDIATSGISSMSSIYVEGKRGQPKIISFNNKFYSYPSLKELLRLRLVECGWRDQVKIICRDLIKESGQDVSYDKLLSTVTGQARSLVPDSVKKELLQKIKTQLMVHEEGLRT